MKPFIVIPLLALSLTSFSQSVSIATGYSSKGLTCVLLSAEIQKHSIYFKSIQDRVDAAKMLVNYIEKHEVVFGYGYRIHKDVAVFSGIGKGEDRIVAEYNYGNGFVKGNPVFVYEVGFRYDLLHMDYIDLSMIGLMNNYTGLSTMVSITYKFE